MNLPTLIGCRLADKTGVLKNGRAGWGRAVSPPPALLLPEVSVKMSEFPSVFGCALLPEIFLLRLKYISFESSYHFKPKCGVHGFLSQMETGHTLVKNALFFFF